MQVKEQPSMSKSLQEKLERQQIAVQALDAVIRLLDGAMPDDREISVWHSSNDGGWKWAYVQS